MKIYLAARHGRREDMLQMAAMLESHGHHITSRWIRRPAEADDADFSNPWTAEGDRIRLGERLAGDDLADIRACECLIAFTEGPNGGPEANRGGRHVELGIAIALGKKVAIVGPRENIFTCLPNVQQYHNLPELRVGNPLMFWPFEGDQPDGRSPAAKEVAP